MSFKKNLNVKFCPSNIIILLPKVASDQAYFKIFDILAVIGILGKKLTIIVLITLLQCKGGPHMCIIQPDPIIYIFIPYYQLYRAAW